MDACVCVFVHACLHAYMCVLSWKYDGEGISIHPVEGNGLEPENGERLIEKKVVKKIMFGIKVVI